MTTKPEALVSVANWAGRIVSAPGEDPPWVDRFEGVNDGLRALQLSIKAAKRVEGKGESKMKRFAMRMSVAALAALFVSTPTEAQIAAQSGVPKSLASHKVLMHPHQLTLYPHGKPERRHPAYSYTRHPFNQPSPIHNTFMGSRYY